MSKTIKQIIKKIFLFFGCTIRKFDPNETLPDIRKLNIQTIIDVGANTGQFAVELRDMFPKAHIYSFEPLPDCFKKLNENMKNDKHFASFNIALGDSEGEMNMNRSVYSPSSSILTMADTHKKLFPHTKESSIEKIRIQKLDSVLSKNSLPKDILIKVDVQGYEDKVIDGGYDIFSVAKVAILEVSFYELYEHQPLFVDIYEKMRKLGFHYYGALNHKRSPDGKLMYEDSLFIR